MHLKNNTNKNIMAKRLVIAGMTLLAGVCSQQVMAQSNLNGTNKDYVTTAVPFLRISPDARAGAMGDCGIATSPDANAQYWNLAKMPFNEKNFGVSATYTPWLRDLVPDIFLAYIAGYGKFGQDGNQVISASMRYFSLGNINYTTVNAEPNGTGMPREYSFDVGYSRKFSDNLSLGLGMRYIHSAIAAGVANQGTGTNYRPGNAVSADLGVYYTKPVETRDGKTNNLSFGAVISNLGTKISYNSVRRDFIPMNLGLGAAYKMEIDEYNSVTATMDINKLLVPALNGSDTQVSVMSGVFSSFSKGDQIKKLQVSVGGEYWYQNQFAVRAGYFYEDKDNGDRQYITAGLGVRYNVFELNASYIVPQGTGITRNPLSNTVRFSLVFSFDKIEKASGGDDDSSSDSSTGTSGSSTESK